MLQGAATIEEDLEGAFSPQEEHDKIPSDTEEDEAENSSNIKNKFQCNEASNFKIKLVIKDEPAHDSIVSNTTLFLDNFEISV